MTTAIMNIIAKKPNEAINPIAESATSSVFDWTSNSNLLICQPPPISVNSIKHYQLKIYTL